LAACVIVIVSPPVCLYPGPR